jgi:hypothetical protein
MALLKGKFVDANNPLDGSKVKLNNNQALVAKKADGTDKSVVKVNADDKIEFLDQAQVTIDPVEANDLARKSYVDSTAESAAAAKIEDAIVDGVADKAPSQDAVFGALALKQNSLGTGTTSQYLRGDLSWQEISLAPDVIFADNLASLPAQGNQSVLYGTKDQNKLYRWAQGSGGLTPDWTVGASGDFASLQAALADASVQDGDVIGIEAGTYTVSAAIQVNKQVKIIGAGIGQTILETAGTSSDPVNVMVVTADNVLLKDMTIRHKKSTNTSIEAALVVSAGSFPTFTYVSGFIMDSCRVEYCEFGVIMRGNGFMISNSQIAYATGAVSNSNRAIGIYGQQGECFIVDNVFDNSSINSTAFRPIYSTSTNGTSNENIGGKLVIKGNSHLGLLQQFYNQDNIRGTAGSFDLYLLSNTTNETSLFAGLYITTANQADLFGQVVIQGNSISNNHDPATGTGKGLLAIDGVGTALSYRSAPLPVHALGNTLAQLIFRADYAEASGSSGSLVGYKPSVFAPVTVAMDSAIPSEPVAPVTPGGVTYGYVEMSAGDEVEDVIVDGVTNKAPSQNAVYDALELKLSTSLKGAVNGLAELDGDGKIPSSQLPAIAVTDTFVVASEAAMLALTAERGDVAVRTDLSKSFILSGASPSVLADWTELLTPADAVVSVNGQTGSVSLNTDNITEGLTNKYFSDGAAKAACVSDAIVDGVADVAPSQNAVFDALFGKQAQISDLDLRVSTLEDRDLFMKGLAWENNAQVYADGRPGVIDPTAALREGWYFKNELAGQKINWYYYDGANFADVKLSEMSGWAIVTFDAVKTPFFAVYTVPTGTNDARPGFAHSAVVYSVTAAVPVVGTTYVVYFGENPPVRPELPRIQLTKNAAASAGDQAPTERVLTVNLSTDSGAGVNTVQLMVESLGTYASAWKSQVDLKVRRATQSYVDTQLGLKQNSLGTGTTSQYLRGDLTWQEIAMSYPVAQVKHVSKNGVDATADGSEEKPYLTITAAMASITDATPTKRYVVRIAAGNYTEASVAIKANVFLIGEQKEAVRITGAVSMNADFNQASSQDCRSGASMLTFLSAADFNWQTVTSPAGKLYFNEVVFASTVNMYGHNNAIAQAQFNSCIIFGALTISGINVGVFTNNICYQNITLNQHPNGGMATTLVATGGYCGGIITQTAAVDDFNRRSASFLRGFPSEGLVLNGLGVYADCDLVSQGKASLQQLNGAKFVAVNPKINHDLETKMLKPLANNAHNMGDWGKQWMFNFAYVHASAGTDMYLLSAMESYDPAGDSSGKGIFINSDAYGLKPNVSGGDIELETAATSGTGVRGKVKVKARELDVSSAKITNLADGTAPQDAVSKAQLDAAIGALPGGLSGKKETFTLSATDITNAYVDCAHLAATDTMMLTSGGVVHVEGESYTLSTVGGVTRITFIGDLIDPSPSKLVAGDKVYVQYLK